MKPLKFAILPLVASGLASVVFADPQVTLNSLGGFTFQFGGHTFTARTRLSAPNGAWVDSSAGTNVVGNVVTWTTPQFQITRTIHTCKNRIDIVDKVTNTDSSLDGLIVKDSVSGDVAATNGYLAGKSVSTDSERYNPANPSVFANFGTTGLGILAQDKHLRAQGLVSYTAADGLEVLDNSLGVNPGKTVELKWSLYPTASGNFWDFVNTVRKDWNSNFALQGPFSYEPGNFTAVEAAHPEPASYYANWADARDLSYVTSGFILFNDGTKAFGTAMTLPNTNLPPTLSWMSKLQDASTSGGEGHHHANCGPGTGGDDDHHHHHGSVGTVSSLLFFHGQISTEPNADTTYADSKAYDAQGNGVVYSSTQYLPLFLPTLKNSYGAALKSTVKTLLHEDGVGGLYWDEMSLSYPELTAQGFVYGQTWDGTSVDIDPTTHAVTGKKASVALAVEPFQEEIAKLLERKGKTLVANTEPFTKDIADLHVERFVEAVGGDVASTQLEVPLVLADSNVEWTPAAAIADAVSFINQGALYFGWVERWTPNSPDFNSLQYPFTPVDLRPGVLTGKERIITTNSGQYGFRDGSLATVYVFDNTATGTVQTLTPTLSNGTNLYTITVPTGGMAILVKQGGDSRHHRH